MVIESQFPHAGMKMVYTCCCGKCGNTAVRAGRPMLCVSIQSCYTSQFRSSAVAVAKMAPLLAPVLLLAQRKAKLGKMTVGLAFSFAVLATALELLAMHVDCA